MASVRVEIYSMEGNGGQGLVARVDRARAYGSVLLGKRFTTSSSWVLIWQNTTGFEALVTLRDGDSDHEVRPDLTLPGNNAPAFLVEQNEIRDILVKPTMSLYARLEAQ